MFQALGALNLAKKSPQPLMSFSLPRSAGSELCVKLRGDVDSPTTTTAVHRPKKLCFIPRPLILVRVEAVATKQGKVSAHLIHASCYYSKQPSNTFIFYLRAGENLATIVGQYIRTTIRNSGIFPLLIRALPAAVHQIYPHTRLHEGCV